MPNFQKQALSLVPLVPYFYKNKYSKVLRETLAVKGFQVA
jgi:hypothetical protein